MGCDDDYSEQGIKDWRDAHGLTTEVADAPKEPVKPKFAVDELPEFLWDRLAEQVEEALNLPKFPEAIPARLVPMVRRMDAMCERVLADVAVQRQILFRHARVRFGPIRRCHSCWTDQYSTEPTWPCFTLKALALPFADHEDFRSEWYLTAEELL